MDKIRCLDAKQGNDWTLLHGDCVDVARQIPNNSIDFSVFSPPFSGLYIYNDSVADLGNSKDDEEFFIGYNFLVKELFRIVRPGRIVAVHCKDLVHYKNQSGRAGLRDFPGMLIRAHEDAGFTFHSRITIWRDPVREMTKTKAHGLLYKQLRADSTFSRVGLPEYFVVFRKWSMSDYDEQFVQPVEHVKPGDMEGAIKLARKFGALTDEDLIALASASQIPLAWWQETASPVWMNTRETDVLNSQRNPNDEKHICPLPLDLIERITTLYSNPRDVVLSPFAGIGSEGYVSLKKKRKFLGVELKKEYFEQASRHLNEAERSARSMFDLEDVA